MKTFQPLAVIGGVPTKTGIRFNHPTEEIVVSSHETVVWAILALCDGQNDANKIIKKVVKSTAADEELVAAIIDDLTSLEVLIDSRSAYKYFHKLGNNLPVFASGLTPSEVFAVQMSDHLPSHEGERFLLKSGDSQIAKLGGSRKSVRSFSSAPIEISQLEEILRVGYSKELVASPSAGGLYPIRIYAIILKPVNELGEGIYEYDSDTHALIKFSPELDHQSIQFALNSDSLLHGAPLILVIAAELDRQPTKYANRGYRYALIEAGHVAQNVHLVSQELGLSTLEYCGFQDGQLADVLMIKDSGIEPILTVAVGFGASSSPKTAEALADELATNLVGKGKPVNWVKLVNSPQTEESYSFFHFISHYRSGNHDDARASYRDRLCGGTSTSFAMANVKAIAEAYERNCSGMIRIDAVSTAKSFENRRWIDPRIFAPYSDDQVGHFSSLQRFSEDAVWEWVNGFDYASREDVMVPIDLVYYPLSSQKLGRGLCHYANSSGVAAHTDIEKAVTGGLLELIERDAIIRNWAEKSVPKRIPTDRLPIHWRNRSEYWSGQGYTVDFIDLSREGVAIVAVVIHSNENYPHFVTGTSASIESLEAAYSKAFQEAELTVIHLKQKGKKFLRAQDLVQPMDHGYFYAQREQSQAVKYLWSGSEAIPAEPVATVGSLVDRYAPVVVDLSGDYPYLKVVRVFSQELIPINFGYGADHLTHHGFPESIRKKHFSELEPHYLA